MNATTTNTITLADYANARESVVLFWAGNGAAGGSYDLLGNPDWELYCGDVLDLTGTVDESGDWHWDGHGNPTDEKGNTVYRLHAYVDAAKWAALANAE